MKSIYFRDFIQLQRGFDLPKTQMITGKYPVIGSTSIIGFHNEYKNEPPGVVTGRSGSLGFVQFINQKYWPHNTSLWVRDFKGNYPRYVYYFLNWFDLKRFNSGAGVPTLNRNDLDNYEINIHEKDEQTKIASILSAYDDLIENNMRRIQILEQMAQSIYKEWFVNFRFPGHENAKFVDSPLGKIPEGWEASNIYDSVDILSGGTPKTSNEMYYNGRIPFYTPKDAVMNYWVLKTEKGITEEGLNNCNSKLYPKHTVFITARGTVGKLNLNWEPMAINQSCYALLSRRQFSQFYLFFSLLNYVGHMKQVATGGVFDTIIVDTFKIVPLLIPPIELLNEFDNKISPILFESLTLERKNQNLRHTRDLLLPKLMSGEVEV